MIKVIKHGTKPKFTKLCPHCGCEFEDEIEDLQTDYSLCLTSYPGQYRRYILCPDCGERIEHDTIMCNPPMPKVVYCNNLNDINIDGFDPCKDCPNKGGPKDAMGNPVAGDSPCQWCSKSPFRATNFSEGK